MKYLKISIVNFIIAVIIIFFWILSGCSYNDFLYGPVIKSRPSDNVIRLKKMSLITQLEYGRDLHEKSARSLTYGGNNPDWDLEWVKIYQEVIDRLEKCK